MKNNCKTHTLSNAAAELGVGIDNAEKAVVSKPQTGDTDSFDAESTQRKNAEFDKLISGEYKKQFTEKVKRIIDRRIKEVKETKEAADKNAAIVSMLMEKYNIADGDTDKLERMINNSMNNFKQSDNPNVNEIIKRLIAENNFLKRDRMEKLRSIEANNRVEKWKQQAEKTKKIYPEFDLAKQLENDEFKRLLKAGVSVKSAYEVVNIDGILDKNSKDAEKMVVNSIISKGKRPVENGTDSSSGILLSNNISKLTKKERAELAKRAARGEHIEF